MNLFVYGTLLIPEIRELVGGRSFDFEPALLTDHAVYRVKGATFPAMVTEIDSTAKGKVLFDLNDDELSRFDRYEDEFYCREKVFPQTKNGVVESEAYLIQTDAAAEQLTEEKWDVSWFREHHCTDFINRLRSHY